MRSGELAKRAGVSADTLRHYEKKGLLPSPHRGANGYREYPEAAVHRVRLIQRALDMGFSLGELGRVLKQRDSGGAPCRQVRAIAATRLDELEGRIERLQQLRTELRAMLSEWDERLAGLPAGQRAGLLDALATREPSIESRREALAPAARPDRRRRSSDRAAAAEPRSR